MIDKSLRIGKISMIRRCSSVGQSMRLISAVSGVQIPAPPPIILLKEGTGLICLPASLRGYDLSLRILAFRIYLQHASSNVDVLNGDSCQKSLILIKLRYLSDSKRRWKAMTKPEVLDLIRDVLIREEKLIFAYVYGSFVKEQTFRDIDIGIYVKAPEENPFVISSDLKTELSRYARNENLDFTADQFDLRIINHAPFTFLNRVFKEGILLVDHDPELRTDVVEYVSLKYRECAGLLAEASLQ